MSRRPNNAVYAIAAALVALTLAPACPALADTVPGTGKTIGIGDTSNQATSTVFSTASYGGEQDGAAAVGALRDEHSHTTYTVHKLGPTEADQTPGVTIENGQAVVRKDEGWRLGKASAYTLACNDGYDATASGEKLTETSMTVAVPVNRADLLGKTVEIYYNGTTVSAKITDTGGFAAFGRDLDLAGGVWRALGASSTEEWGVRTVAYRIL